MKWHSKHSNVLLNISWMWLLTYLPKSQLFTKLQQKLTFHKSLTQHQHINVQTQGHAAENTQMKIQNYKGKGGSGISKVECGITLAALWPSDLMTARGRQDGGRGTCGQELLDTVLHVGATVSRVGKNCAIACSACRQCLVHLIRGDGCFCLSTCMYQTCLILYQEILKSNLPGGSWKEDQEVGPLNNVKCLPDSHWVKGAW